MNFSLDPEPRDLREKRWANQVVNTHSSIYRNAELIAFADNSIYPS